MHFLLFDYWDTQQDQASTEERVEICYVHNYMYNGRSGRNIMMNFNPADCLPEWGRCFLVSDTGGLEERILYHPVYGCTPVGLDIVSYPCESDFC